MRGTFAAASAAFFVSFLSTTAIAVPLPPGHPAGVRGAQLEQPQPLVVLGLAAVAIGVTLAVTGNDNNGVPGTGGNGGTGPVSTPSSTH